MSYMEQEYLGALIGAVLVALGILLAEAFEWPNY